MGQPTITDATKARGAGFICCPDRGLKLERLADMITGFSKRWRLPALGILMIVVWLGPINHGKAAETGQQVFLDSCAECHTIGKGKLVGPDLAGVTSRREASWLQRQIKDPESLIAENDPIALQLVKEADDVEMPGLELSDEQVAAVIAYLKSTEQLANVEIGTPSQYMPTILISIIVLIGLTLIALKVGSKKVNVS